MLNAKFVTSDRSRGLNCHSSDSNSDKIDSQLARQGVLSRTSMESASVATKPRSVMRRSFWEELIIQAVAVGGLL
jgi:hypothetical protein